ncbi:MAG: phage integrase N-terminal SAM-like domain-containing protein [Spirochaetes bacterium]|nr:phage integrase N-terminal SAM-like domain-containing protein [Spirochaetota bacterium]
MKERIWTIPDTHHTIDLLLNELYSTGNFTCTQVLEQTQQFSKLHKLDTGADPSVEPFISAMIRELKLKGYNRRTIISYVRQVRLFLQRTGIPPVQVRRGDIVLYLEKLQSITGHLDRSTMAHIISGLRALFQSIPLAFG